jgi:asparagine synthase (glutamine-hydrolysing)
LFGGYPSFSKIPAMLRWGNFLRAAGLSGVVASALKQSQSPQAKRIADFLGKAPSAASAFRSLRGIFSERETGLLMRQYIPDSEVVLPAMDTPLNMPSLKDKISFLELSRYMLNQLLRDSDSFSMAHALEIRVPFVDREFFDIVSSIPSDMRILPNKRLLVNAVPELPKDVFDRPKRGFLFPFQKWMEKDWEKDLFQAETPKGVSLDLWYRRWGLAVLNQWIKNNLK